jgi:hypothetical protein
MQTLPNPNLLVEKYAALLPELDGDDLHGGVLKQTFVDRCLTWLARYDVQPQTNVA